MGQLWHAISQFLPEPSPVRPYVHPSQYKAVENVRHYSDGMHKLYQPNYFTLAVATVTLGLYIGVPHILLGLLCFSWYRPALITLGVLLATLLLPAKPLRVNSVLSSYVFLCWRRYFKFSYLFEKSLDCYQDYIIAQFPHGAFPLGALLGGTFMATEYPEYYCYALAASSAFYVPIWRHVHAWLGTEVCTKTNFHHLLSLGVKGPLKRHGGASAGHSPFAAGDSQHTTDGQQQELQQPEQQQPEQQRLLQGRSCSDSGGYSTLPRLSSAMKQRRFSLTGGIRATFRHHHSLSDTESSDSDCDTCSCSPPRRLSIGSNASSVGVDSSADSCSSSCRNCHVPLAAVTPNSPGTPQDKQPHSKSKQQQHRHGSSKQQQQPSSNWRLDPVTGKRKTGVSVGLMVGGIAEMFMIRRDHERIKLKDRKGFVRIALEHGTPILPVYMFGTNQVLDFGPPWLQRISRKMRASVGMIYGLWGLPVPRRLPIFMVTGKPLEVGPAMRKDHPDFAARVDELHAQFMAEMERIYYTHRAKYGHGYENRPLVIS